MHLLRHARTLVVVALALAPLASCTKTAARTSPIRHVVVISLDTTRADHFGFMGNREVKTPRLDELARESIVFTDCMTVAPSTLASHTSLFTGLYPHNHGTPRNSFVVPQANVMLPEILKDAGFYTVGFVGAIPLHSRFGFDQGFDHFDERVEDDVARNRRYERIASRVTDDVLAYLDEQAVPERLFLFVHYFDPHRPYEPPAPYDTLYDARGSKELPTLRSFVYNSSYPQKLKDEWAARHAALYAGEVTYLDHHVGRLLDGLRERDILDDALVVVTSDHGENLWGEHPDPFAHGFNLFQSTMHVLCLFRLPGARHGGVRVDQLIANIDIEPTVLSLLGLEPPVDVDGEAIALDNIEKGIEPRVRFCEATRPVGEQYETDPRWTNMLKSRCIRDGDIKFVQTPYKNVEELYDLGSDPDEQVNLLLDPTLESKTLADRYRDRLEAWADSAHPLQSTQEESEEMEKKLRALGYIK